MSIHIDRNTQPASRAAFLQVSKTVSREIGQPGFTPGNNQSVGRFQRWRSSSIRCLNEVNGETSYTDDDEISHCD